MEERSPSPAIRLLTAVRLSLTCVPAAFRFDAPVDNRPSPASFSCAIPLFRESAPVLSCAAPAFAVWAPDSTAAAPAISLSASPAKVEELADAASEILPAAPSRVDAMAFKDS